MNYYSIIRPLLFSLDEELAHNFSLSLLNFVPNNLFTLPKTNPINCFGLTFSHPVGLAAGFDKNAQYIDALAKLGFSFIEVGTVTPRPQSGNSKKRLFRIPEAGAIINRMGFNNLGVDNLIENVKKSTYTGILGINIGKNADTQLKDAVTDYIFCMQKVYPYASYITVNISSPNTKDLRLLQQEEFFANFIKTLVQTRNELNKKFKRYVPLIVKLSPDESEETINNIARVLLEYEVEGVIATNTTQSKAVAQYKNGNEQGGLSGKPLREKSTQTLLKLKSFLENKVTLIGCGGIDSYSAMKEKFDNGASLVQVYTGLIYEGPGLISKLIKELNHEENLI